MCLFECWFICFFFCTIGNFSVCLPWVLSVKKWVGRWWCRVRERATRTTNDNSGYVRESKRNYSKIQYVTHTQATKPIITTSECPFTKKILKKKQIQRLGTDVCVNGDNNKKTSKQKIKSSSEFTSVSTMMKCSVFGVNLMTNALMIC